MPIVGYNVHVIDQSKIDRPNYDEIYLTNQITAYKTFSRAWDNAIYEAKMRLKYNDTTYVAVTHDLCEFITIDEAKSRDLSEYHASCMKAEGIVRIWIQKKEESANRFHPPRDATHIIYIRPVIVNDVPLQIQQSSALPKILAYRIHIECIELASTWDHAVLSFTQPIPAYSCLASALDAAIVKATEIAAADLEVRVWHKQKIVPINEALADNEYLEDINEIKKMNYTSYRKYPGGMTNLTYESHHVFVYEKAPRQGKTMARSRFTLYIVPIRESL